MYVISSVTVMNSVYSVKVDDAISSLCTCVQLLAQPFRRFGITEGSRNKDEPHPIPDVT